MYLLSVIIPIYNAAFSLDTCLLSILTAIQNDSDAVQMVLIDDGSTDQSGEICDVYAKKYKNISAYHKTNGGIASARNAGLDHAFGRYIAWVDADDSVSEEWFRRIRDAIRQGEPDVIVMDSIRCGKKGRKREIYGRPGGYVDRDLFVEDVVRDIRMLSGLPNKVIKDELFHGVWFDTSLTVLEDYAAMPMILRQAKTVYYIPACLYHYCQHETSLLHQSAFEQAFRAVEVALEREKIVEPGFRAAAVTAAACQAFSFCWQYYRAPKRNDEKEHFEFCRNYIQENLSLICHDKELPRMLRLKMILLTNGLYGQMLRLFTGRSPIKK